MLLITQLVCHHRDKAPSRERKGRKRSVFQSEDAEITREAPASHRRIGRVLKSESVASCAEPLQRARRAGRTVIASLGSSLNSITHGLHLASNALSQDDDAEGCTREGSARSYRLTAQVQAAPTLPAPLTPSPGVPVCSIPQGLHIGNAGDAGIGQQATSEERSSKLCAHTSNRRESKSLARLQASV